MSRRNEWEVFARRDPYYAVLTEQRFRGASEDPQRLREFFGSGREDYRRIVDAARSIEPSFRPQSFLDYGCGVGRVLLPAAAECDHVTGVDVAPAMLERAAAHAREEARENVRLLLAEGFRAGAEQFDLVNCYLVLQHVDPSDGMQILASLIERVHPGGFLSVHVLFWREGGMLRRLGRWIRRRVPGANALLNLPGRRGSEYMQMNVYDLPPVLRMLHRGGLVQARTLLTDHGGMLGMHLVAGPRQAPDRAVSG
jgi:SAM-dependent methyltransferase